MSIDNSELLMLLGGKKSKSTIGIAGQQGFGVGVYGGDPADLTSMGLAPMEGCENPNSENYGNYIHTNGSIMVFIPAFAIRIGNASAPLYSKYGADTIEIGDVKLNGKDGWAIPRGFYDGGKPHSGFFIDKYLCSKDSTGTLAVSVKNVDPISLDTSYNPSSTMPNCVGKAIDAIELSRARGEYYSLVSCYQWAVISLVTQAHAQAATSVESCAWYDAAGLTNYPKGNNNNTESANKDVDDKSISFTNTSYYGLFAKTGSAIPLAKTTHNGQLSGICDVNGNKWQPVLGCQLASDRLVKIAKLSVKMHDFTKDNNGNDSMFDSVAHDAGKDGQFYWQRGKALYSDTSGSGWVMNGVLPKTVSGTTTDALYGRDWVEMIYSNYSLSVAGTPMLTTRAGVWSRDVVYWYGKSNGYGSFRAAAYPP